MPPLQCLDPGLLVDADDVDAPLGQQPGPLIQVTDRLGRTWDYDELVLATGSDAAMPPIPGNDLAGVFVYRTIDDVAALRGWVEERRARFARPVRGAVIGGGLLGLEAAGALKALDAQRGKLPVPKGPVPTSMKGMRSQQRGR